MIIDEIIAYAQTLCKEQKISDVRLGRQFAAVSLDDGSCGIAYLLNQYEYCKGITIPGTMKGMKAQDMIKLAAGLNSSEASLGIATINALLQKQTFALEIYENAIDAIDIKKTDTIGMIGSFHALMQPLQERAGKIYVFEKDIVPDTYPDWAEPVLLPECDIVLISGTTLINKSLDYVLSLCVKAREIVLLGPTALALPQILCKHGITLIGACRVTDKDAMLDTVSQGGNGRHIQKCSQMFCIKA